MNALKALFVVVVVLAVIALCDLHRRQGKRIDALSQRLAAVEVESNFARGLLGQLATAENEKWDAQIGINDKTIEHDEKLTRKLVDLERRVQLAIRGRFE